MATRDDYRRSMLPAADLLVLVDDLAARIMAQDHRFTRQQAYHHAAYWFPARVRRVVAAAFGTPDVHVDTDPTPASGIPRPVDPDVGCAVCGTVGLPTVGHAAVCPGGV